MTAGTITASDARRQGRKLLIEVEEFAIIRLGDHPAAPTIRSIRNSPLAPHPCVPSGTSGLNRS